MSGHDTLIQRIAGQAIGAACRLIARRVDWRAEGLEHIPRAGPVLIAARHYHHLYDVPVLMAAVPRPLHVVVALDWVRGARSRRLMEWACRTARWPGVLRVEQSGGHTTTAGRASGEGERRSYLRGAAAEAVALLREGRVLVVFPEGYPTIDPNGTPKTEDQPFLPFRPGFARLAALAARDGRDRPLIVPAGLEYERGRRWRVVVRFGLPLEAGSRGEEAALIEAVSARVQRLSGEGRG